MGEVEEVVVSIIQITTRDIEIEARMKNTGIMAGKGLKF
jgi:hypothetical protein